MFKRKTLLDSQIEVFSSYAERAGKTYSFEFLKDLTRFTDDILDLTDEDILDFLMYVRDKYSTEYSADSAKRVLNSLRRFYMARGNNIKMPVGRPPAVENIEKAKKYKGMGFSIREIARLLKSDVSRVHKWVHYDPNRLEIFKQEVIHSGSLQTPKQGV